MASVPTGDGSVTHTHKHNLDSLLGGVAFGLPRMYMYVNIYIYIYIYI